MTVDLAYQAHRRYALALIKCNEEHGMLTPLQIERECDTRRGQYFGNERDFISLTMVKKGLYLYQDL